MLSRRELGEAGADEETTRRPAHQALARAIVIAPIGAVISILARDAYGLARWGRVDLQYSRASVVTMTVMLAYYLLVEEAARGRTRGRALAMFAAAAVVHVLLLYPALGALWSYAMGWTSNYGGAWPLLNVWEDVARAFTGQWDGDLLAPVFLSGLPLLALAVARGVLRLAGWAQLLVVAAAATSTGAAFGLLLALLIGYQPEAWRAMMASASVLCLADWMAIPLGLRVGDRVAPWVLRRVAQDLATITARWTP